MTVLSMQELSRRGRETKARRARQRHDLRGCPPPVLVAMIVNPPREMASYRLRQLFGAQAGRGQRGLIPQFGASALRKVLIRLALDPEVARDNWHAELRLNELTPREREHLAQALVAAAPPSWRGKKTPSSLFQIEPKRKAS